MQNVSIFLKNAFHGLMIVFSLVCLAMAMLLFWDGYQAVIKHSGTVVIEPLEKKWLNEVKLALNSNNRIKKVNKNMVPYKNPFRKNVVDQKRTFEQGEIISKVHYNRKILTIVGILGGENPFVIFKDDEGKSIICKKGDTIYNQTVISIESDKVILRDVDGLYALINK